MTEILAMMMDSSTCKKPENQLVTALWQQPCSDEQLVTLSKLVSDWTAIAPHLGLSQIDIEDIIERYPRSAPAQRISMLRKWREEKGAAATYEKLCVVLKTCDRQDLVDKISEMLLTVSGTTRTVGMLCLHVGVFRILGYVRPCL